MSNKNKKVVNSTSNQKTNESNSKLVTGIALGGGIAITIFLIA